MTTRRSTLEASAAQERVIAALLATGHSDAARRLRRCMEARTTRRHAAGWPFTCRTNAGCAWCRKTLARRWWKGMRLWIAQDSSQASLAVLRLPRDPAGLHARVARTRRALRDVRDRAARRRAPWRSVAFAGMATGDGTAFVFVLHPGVARQEVASVLRRRWPAAVVGEVGSVEPSWSMSVEDAAELARARRGVEPLRVVVLAQRAADKSVRDGAAMHGDTTPLAPMPVAF